MIAGSIMSFSIVLTLHITDFVNATPAIFQVWTTLRDVTSLFFIFFLLLAAFKIILGIDGKIGGKLIKNLVLAGILINFSFFITGAMIDASNIVSQALYNAMVPVSASSAAVGDIQSGNMSNMLHDVTGISASSATAVDSSKYTISDIFRNALNLSSVSGGTAPQDAVANPLKIFMIVVVGIMIMVTAALSFFAAALAFIIRLVILIFLLAVSPLWFASWIIPELKKQFDFLGKLMPQLIFMPVYLLLMYVGLKVIAGSKLLTAANAATTSLPTGSNWAFPYIVIAMNFAIVIVVLNLPLFVALAMSGNLSKKFMEKIDARNIWKNFGSQAGSRTLGRAAYSLNERITPRLAGVSPLLGSLSNAGLSSVSKAGFGAKKGGYEDRLKAKKKSEEDMHKAIGDKMKNRGASDTDIREAQAKYRSKLPWKSGVMGFMLDNRAHVETQKKLDKKAKDEQKKGG